MRFMQFVSQFHREESGQDMLEYALVLAAVLTAVVAGFDHPDGHDYRLRSTRSTPESLTAANG